MEFSIIIPVYNVEKYLPECLDSILNQTVSNYEIILVDDGSTDNSGLICDEYASHDARIRVIHQINSGQAIARNEGLKISSGDYVFFIDSDDFLIDRFALEKLHAVGVDNPDIIHFKFVEWFENDGHIAPCKFSYNVDIKEKTVAEIYTQLIDRDAYYNSAWSKCIRRTLLIDNNILFEAGIVGEDNEWYYHVVMVAETLRLIDEPLYVYRRRRGSTTTTPTEKNLKDQLHVLTKWETLLESYVDNPKSVVVQGSLAKQYCSALILYARLQGDWSVSAYNKEIHRLSYLLKYSNNHRVRVFRTLKRFLGINGTIKALSLFLKLRG